MIKSLVILIICLFVIIAGGILIWQSWLGGETPSPSPSPNPTQAADETADWKTYTNQEFGYEIRYPDFYYMNFPHIYDENSGETTLTINGVYFRNEEYKENPSGGCEFSIYIKSNPLNKNLGEWFADNSTEAEFGTDEHEKSGKTYYNSKQAQSEKITINGQEALKFYQIGGYPNDTISILFEKDIYIIEIGYFPNCSPELNIFNQMLSTFKFID